MKLWKKLELFLELKINLRKSWDQEEEDISKETTQELPYVASYLGIYT